MHKAEQLSLLDIEAMPDAADRAVAAHALISTIRAEASRVRQAAVAELRDGGWSHQRIADLLGIAKGTAQLIAEGRSTGRRPEAPTQQRRNGDDAEE